MGQALYVDMGPQGALIFGYNALLYKLFGDNSSTASNSLYRGGPAGDVCVLQNRTDPV